MNVEEACNIAEKELHETFNNESAYFADRHAAMQTYLLAHICQKLEVEEQKSSEVGKDRRLILQLTESFNENPSDAMLTLEDRERAFKRAFRKMFPEAPKFKESEQILSIYVDWKYWIVGIQQKHIEWARVAKQCGLIDAYIVDYDSEQEVES